MAELTPKSQRKLAALLQTAQDAEAAAQALLPKRRKLEDEAAIARRQSRAAPEDDVLARIAGDLARELAELDAEQERRRERHQFAMINYNRAREWAHMLPHRAVLVDIAAPKPIGGDLAAHRAAIAYVKDAMAKVRSATPMAGEMEAMVRAYVERTGEKYRPRPTLTTGGGPMCDFAYVDVMSPLGPFGVACWLTPDLVVKRLTSEFAAQFGTGGMTAEKRAEVEREGTAELDRLERVEESLVEVAPASGQDAVRRHDASAPAILGVTVSNMAAAAA